MEEIAEYVDTHDLSQEMEQGRWEDDVVAEPMVTTSLRLPKPTMDQLRIIASQRGVKPTALMREWVEAQIYQEREHGGDEYVSTSSLLSWLGTQATR